MNKRISITQLIRHLVQLAVFILLPGLFITVFSSLGEIISSLVKGSFSFGALSAQLITVFSAFLITALWGRFFCGFLCSFGALQELAAFISSKVFPRKKALSQKLDSILKVVKYLVLAFIITAVWVLAMPVDAAHSPWGVFGMIVSGNLSVMSAAIPTIGFVIFVLILIGAFYTERFFCRYLCPLGALFALISGKRLYKIKKNSSTCVECGLCSKKCCMGINVPENDSVSSGECIDCMRCIDVCRKNSLKASPMPAAAGTAAAIAICGLVKVGNLTVPEASAPEINNNSSVETGKYRDGIYTGSAQGFGGNTKVQVTVENGNITDITVLSHDDDTEFFNKAKAGVISSIISNQSVDVSVVSGATFSSEGIINAVAAALSPEVHITEASSAASITEIATTCNMENTTESTHLSMAESTAVKTEISTAPVTAAKTTASTTAKTAADTAARTTESTTANTTASTTVRTTAGTTASTTVRTTAGTTASTTARTTAGTTAITTAKTTAGTTARTTAKTTAGTTTTVKTTAATTANTTVRTTTTTRETKPTSNVKADGIYQGTGTGFRGATKVSVTVENGKITDITIESYQDDDRYFERAEGTIISEIIGAQSINVQTVSRATFSSNGIIEAVANALGLTFNNPNSSRRR